MAELKELAARCMQSVRDKDSGTPSAELAEATSALAPRVYKHLQSI